MVRSASNSKKEADASSLVGKEALAYCTSCKLDLAHIIVAMKGDQIKKAQCKTCKKEHAYKAPKGITELNSEKATKTRKPRTKKSDDFGTDATSIEAEWQKLMLQHKSAAFKTYNPKSHFALGDKVQHPSFGEGIVGKHLYPNKIEVIFQNNIKILVHQGHIYSFGEFRK